VRQVEEVDVRLHKALGQQLDAKRLGVDFLVELEGAFVVGHVASAGLVGGGAWSLLVGLAAVLL
jgi:hypothetical protein